MNDTSSSTRGLKIPPPQMDFHLHRATQRLCLCQVALYVRAWSGRYLRWHLGASAAYCLSSARTGDWTQLMKQRTNNRELLSH
jgi:hypothetical protein